MKTSQKQKIGTKKSETYSKESSNITSQTLIYSLLVLAYIVVIWYPYTFSVAPRNGATLERASIWAHIICVLIFLPTLPYIRFIIKHFKEVNKFRFILYPLIYIACFILLHAGLFTISPVFLWFWIITVPAWIIWFIAIIIEAIAKDIKDVIVRKNEKKGNNTIEKDTKSKK